MGMKRIFYLPTLTKLESQRLMAAMMTHFRSYGLTPKFDEATSELSYEMASIGRAVHCVGTNEETMIRNMDDLRCENVSCYVNGFYAAVK